MSLKTRKFFAAWVLSVFLIFAVVGGAHAYSSVLAFGDSLSDNGYYQSYPGGTFGNTNPADVYGFKRYSNGPVWVEQLAGNLGVSLLDMAYGGATSGSDNPAAYDYTGDSRYLTETGLQWQVSTYASTYQTINANTLITVWAGGNDMLNYDPTNPIPYNPVQAAANVVTAVGNLYALGGRNFAVLNLSWNAITDPEMLAGAQAWMGYFNLYLAQYLQGLDAQLQGINIYDIDLTKLYYEGLNLNGTFTNPGNEIGPFANWDTVHPTTEAHQQIAGYVANQVPEPASIILLILGFAGLVGARRRMK